MLVLTTRAGDSVILRDSSGKLIGEIRCRTIKSDRVRLAFDVPEHIEINRRSIDARIYADTPQS